jgi:hypothetical protein
MQTAVSSDHANTKYEAELQSVIKKHGFKDLAKYEVVATNISMVMAAIDSQARRRGGFEPPPSGRD